MIAMRSLSSMYFAAGWIRTMFRTLAEKRASRVTLGSVRNRPGEAEPAQASTRLSNPTVGLSFERPVATDGCDSGIPEGIQDGPDLLERQEMWPDLTAMEAVGYLSMSIGDFINSSTIDDTSMLNLDPGLMGWKGI